MEHSVPVSGSGRVTVAAYGVADAEHLVEKEIGQAWPEARVQVTQIVRAGEGMRIAEEFQVSYQLHCTLAVDAPSPDQARGEAFRRARERLAGTRYWRTAWEAKGS